ncbi:MCE family protein [uncultured Williamsia sp.]|uniref:MCE family protein n=1 Tax=uncultured Williamsia sp. TaxID=259311 RepID=UPI002626539B|nr:MCE family protein [uncultured Williamsia sp.]
MRRLDLRKTAAALLVVAVLVGAYVGYRVVEAPMKVTAYFGSTTSIYVGDAVTVAGVTVGKIDSITPRGTQNEIVMSVDHGVKIPAGASAVIISRSLIAARSVQFTPSYTGTGPTMRSGATIPRERTAVPVEWDEVKTQLKRLADTLGPQGDDATGTLSRFIDSAGTALAGNGDKLRGALTELAQSSKILSDKSSDIGSTIAALQTFVSALKGSTQQISSLQANLGSLTSTISAGSSDLDGALRNLATASTEVQAFIAGSRDQVSETVQRLGDATRVLVDKTDDLQQLLHVAPNALANYNNNYNPTTGSLVGVFVTNNFASPANFLCDAVASLRNATSAQGAQLCADYLGPALNTVAVNYPTFGINPLKPPAPAPGRLLYSQDKLEPSADSSQQSSSPPKKTPVTSLQQLLVPGSKP